MSLCVICDVRPADESDLCPDCQRELDDYRFEMNADWWEGSDDA